MDLYTQIMNIPAKKKDQQAAIDYAMRTCRNYMDILCSVYQQGHRDARHKAAELASEHESKEG